MEHKTRTIKLVKIMLDKERTMLLDLNGMVAFEEVTGRSLLKGLRFSDLTSKDVRALLWACLIHEDKDLTLEQIGKMITMQNYNDVFENINEAMSAALPDQEEAGDGAADPLTENRPNG